MTRKITVTKTYNWLIKHLLWTYDSAPHMHTTNFKSTYSITSRATTMHILQTKKAKEVILDDGISF